MRLLVGAQPAAGEVDPPGLRRVRGAIAQLRERDAELGCPPRRIDGHGRTPDGVPGAIALRVVEDEFVALHVGRADAKEVAGAPIVIRVERHLEEVGLTVLIASDHLSGDRPGLAIEHPCADPEIGIVDEDPDLGRLFGGAPFDGDPLDEMRCDVGGEPRLVVEAPIEPDVAGTRHDPHRGTRGDTRRARDGRAAFLCAERENGTKKKRRGQRGANSVIHRQCVLGGSGE